jgi:hypothetical protein
LKPKLAPHEVVTVREMGWSGIKNGKLMSLCTENNFEVLLTIDKNLQYQQNLDKYSIAIVVFDSNSSDISGLKNYIPEFLARIEFFEKDKAHLLTK